MSVNKSFCEEMPPQNLVALNASQNITCLFEVTIDTSRTTSTTHSVVKEQALTAMVDPSPGKESVLLKTAIVFISKNN